MGAVETGAARETERERARASAGSGHVLREEW